MFIQFFSYTFTFFLALATKKVSSLTLLLFIFGASNAIYANDSEWIHCADDWHRCEVPVPATVRYGANGEYAYLQVEDAVDCYVGVFGNSIGAVKTCDYQLSNQMDADEDGVVDSLDHFPADASETADSDGDGFGDNTDPFPSDSTNQEAGHWRFCENEYRYCNLPFKSLVRYGAKGVYSYKELEGRFACYSGTFESLLGLRDKRCEYLLSDEEDFDNDGVVDSADIFPLDSSETQDGDGDGVGDNSDPYPSDAKNNEHGSWVHCVQEFGVCTPPVPALVRYGLNGIYYYRNVTGSIDCKNAAFGNPINERKVCEYLLSDTVDYDADGVVDLFDFFSSR